MLICSMVGFLLTGFVDLDLVHLSLLLWFPTDELLQIRVLEGDFFPLSCSQVAAWLDTAESSIEVRAS